MRFTAFISSLLLLLEHESPMLLHLANHVHRLILLQFGENQLLRFEVEGRHLILPLVFAILRLGLYGFQVTGGHQHVDDCLKHFVLFGKDSNVFEVLFLIPKVLMVDVFELEFQVLCLRLQLLDDGFILLGLF